MRLRFLKHAGLALTFLLMTSVGRMYACSCGRPTACEAFASAAVVFVGHVIDGTEKISDREEQGVAGDVRFAVEERFKGVTIDEITIKVYRGIGTCLYSVQTGVHYVVFAHKNDKGEVGIGFCSPVFHVEYATEQLEFLRHLPPPGLGGRLYGQVGTEVGFGEPIPTPDILVKTTDERGKVIEVRTDRAGKFELNRLSPGKYRVEPVLPAYLTRREYDKDPREAIVDDRGCTSSNFWVNVKGKVNGKIQDHWGRAAPATVRLVSIDDENRRFLGFAYGDGEYEIDGVPPGCYRLWMELRLKASSSGAAETKFYYPGVFDEERAGIVTVALAEQVKNYDFTLPEALRVQMIFGTVQYKDGSLSPFAEITVRLDEPSLETAVGTETYSSEFRADEQGHFKIPVFLGNKYKIFARDEILAASRDKRPILYSESKLFTVVDDISNINLTLSTTDFPPEFRWQPPGSVRRQ